MKTTTVHSPVREALRKPATPTRSRSDIAGRFGTLVNEIGALKTLQALLAQLPVNDSYEAYERIIEELTTPAGATVAMPNASEHVRGEEFRIRARKLFLDARAAERRRRR